jgi:PAS domain S-box-containing protein
LAAIIEYSDEVVLSVAVDGNVISWNRGAERQYGYTAEEMMGQPLLVLFSPDQHHEYHHLMDKIRRGEPVPPYEAVRRCKDGSFKNVSVSLTPIEGRDGEIVGASKISHDITKLKRLEAQVHRRPENGGGRPARRRRGA